MVHRRWAGVVVVPVALLMASCGTSGGQSDATATTKPPAKTTTTLAEPPKGGEEVQQLLESIDEAIAAEAAARDELAKTTTVIGLVESTESIRADLFDFDADLRDVEVADDARRPMNALLEANGAYIAVLDDYFGVQEIAEYNAQIEAELAARSDWYDAIAPLAEVLEIDGVPSPFDQVDDSSSTTEPDGETSSDEIPAGSIAESSTASIEVPEGFTATAAVVVEMEDDNGSLVGIYTVTSDTATTLEEAAAEASSGAAEKNGYTITGGPEPFDVGSYPGIAYYLDLGDGLAGLDIYFEAEATGSSSWHVVSIEAATDDIEQVAAAVEAVLPTLTVS